MGGTSWSSAAYQDIAASYSTKSTDKIFTSTKLNKDMSPHGLKVRESRDSPAHPETLAIAVFLDETGSMGQIPEKLARGKLGELYDVLLKNRVEHPAIMFCGIGDHKSDKYPLQVGQFESGTDELNKWLTSIFLEGNGGGQMKESYGLAYLVAGRHTSIDCFEKRNQKGFLFTVGDEAPWESMDGSTIKNLMGYDESTDLSLQTLYEDAAKMYNIFHIHINHDQFKNKPKVIDAWRKLLGERLLLLDNYENTAELIASTVAVCSGNDLDKVVKTMSKKAGDVVSRALMPIKNNLVANINNSAIMTL